MINDGFFSGVEGENVCGRVPCGMKQVCLWVWILVEKKERERERRIQRFISVLPVCIVLDIKKDDSAFEAQY